MTVYQKRKTAIVQHIKANPKDILPTVAEKFGVCERTVRRACNDAEIKVPRLPRHLRKPAGRQLHQRRVEICKQLIHEEGHTQAEVCLILNANQRTVSEYLRR